MKNALYLVDWKFQRNLTPEEAIFIKNFSQTDSDNSYGITREDFEETKKEYSTNQRLKHLFEDVARLPAMTK